MLYIILTNGVYSSLGKKRWNDVFWEPTIVCILHKSNGEATWMCTIDDCTIDKYERLNYFISNQIS